MSNCDALAALGSCGAIVGVGVAMSSLETLFSWRHYAHGGIFDGDLLAQHTPLEGSALARTLLGCLFTMSALVALTVLRLICAIALVLPAGGPEFRGIAAAGAFLTGGILVWRNRYGTDGSDQMTAIVLAGVAVGSLFPSSRFTPTAAIAFIATQGCITYIVAEVAKALSPVW
jgi:hypothetical protein